MNTKAQSNLYIIISSTPYKMGRFIRTVTRNEYNHAAISFDIELKTLYSFARHHKKAPFYGGFVTESCLRYNVKKSFSNIKVYAIPLSKKDSEHLIEYLESFKSQPDKYLYNLFSAILVPFHKKIIINNAFTCVEFVISILSLVDDRINIFDYYSISDLEKLYHDKLIYKGIFETTKDVSNWSTDTFLEGNRLTTNTFYTAKSFYRLASNYLHKKPK